MKRDLPNHPRRSLWRKVRTQSGVYMLELLMAIAGSSLIAAALVSNMAESQRMCSQGENQIMAYTIAQQQIDSTRNTPYSSLAACLGQYELRLTPASQYGSLVPVISPQPLLLESSKFNGRVYEKVELGPYVNTLRVTITVTWTEGQSDRNYMLSTIVAKNGINNSGVIWGG